MFSNFVRSKSLTVKLGDNVLVPEVGTASDQVALASGGGEAAMDDLYMEGISIRRGFASEFMALLEVSRVHSSSIIHRSQKVSYIPRDALGRF